MIPNDSLDHPNSKLTARLDLLASRANEKGSVQDDSRDRLGKGRGKTVAAFVGDFEGNIHVMSLLPAGRIDR